MISTLEISEQKQALRLEKRTDSSSAFTLLELLAVIATLTLLVTLLLPTLANTTPDSAATRCRSNHRQIMIAWTMYSDDNQDVLPLNTDQSKILGTPADPSPPWVSGILDWAPHGLGDPNTNTLYLTDPRGSSLANYDGRNASLFKCPTDYYLSTGQWQTYKSDANGSRVQLGRTRSISMNGAIGGGNPTSGQAGYKPPIFLSSILGTQYFYAVKRSQIISPIPSQSWVLWDENPDSIDDAISYTAPSATNGLGYFMGFPASSHWGGGAVAFADGHVEIHRWTDSRTIHPVSYINYHFVQISGQPSADLAWLAQHTPRAP